MIDAVTLLLAALLLLLALAGCATETAPTARSEHDGWGLGALIACLGGDGCGAAWIDHYAETGCAGMDVIHRHDR